MLKIKEWFKKLWLKLSSKILSYKVSIPSFVTEEQKMEIAKQVEKIVTEQKAKETKCTCGDGCKCEDSQKTKKKSKPTTRKKKTVSKTKKAKE